MKNGFVGMLLEDVHTYASNYLYFVIFVLIGVEKDHSVVLLDSSFLSTRNFTVRHRCGTVRYRTCLT